MKLHTLIRNLPKLHKNPYGKRFIAASNKCTTKLLSKLLTTCLAKIICHFREYCNGIYNRTGVNCFWIVDNSQQVLNRLRKTNYFSPVKHFDSFDFSTLYSSIPHDSLKMALTSLVMETYRVRGCTLLHFLSHCGCTLFNFLSHCGCTLFNFLSCGCTHFLHFLSH